MALVCPRFLTVFLSFLHDFFPSYPICYGSGPFIIHLFCILSQKLFGLPACLFRCFFFIDYFCVFFQRAAFCSFIFFSWFSVVNALLPLLSSLFFPFPPSSFFFF